MPSASYLAGGLVIISIWSILETGIDFNRADKSFPER